MEKGFYLVRILRLVLCSFLDDCKAAGKFVCQQSVKCADEDADYFVCKKKKFLCLNTTFICDGKPDCMPHDSSDENCKGIKAEFL